MAYRACKSGVAAEMQRKVESNYDQEEAKKCLYWIHIVTGCEQIEVNPSLIDSSSEHFFELLHDGNLLCKLIDTLQPGLINWNDKTFQTPKIEAMRVMRERERISMFNTLVKGYGVDDAYLFPTESLHEKGALNLAQVCACIRGLGIQAQTKDSFILAPLDYWPKKAEKNVREFTDEQLKAGKQFTSLQYGTNKGASQAGMSMGKHRMVLD